MRVALIFLLLAGCATKPELRQSATVEVHDAVAVSCIKTKPARPNYLTEQLPPTATDIQYADALAVDWPLSRKYEGLLEIAVQACVQ